MTPQSSREYHFFSWSMYSERMLTRQAGDVTNVLCGPAVETLILVGLGVLAEECDDEADKLSGAP